MVKNKNRNNNNFFLIAEAGINHGGNFQKAIKLINTAKETGAHAIKFQTYKTEKRVSRKNKVFDILKKCELNFFDFEKLKKYCEKKKIIFFSTPFDKESVNFLNDINVKLFKIASFDISNYDLIDEIIKTKKKTILSTGMASLNEIKKTYKKFSSNNIDCSLLHCISAYPNKDENSYLSNILFLKNNFNCNIGLSDHTKDIKTSIYSYLLGARIFEKHFKLNNKDNCVDKDVSLTPFQMKLLFNELTKIPKMLGRARFGIRPEEREALKFKRKKVLSWKWFIIKRKDIKNKFAMKIQILTSINSWLNQNKKEEFIKSLNKFSKKINYVNKIANLKKNYDVCIILGFFKIIPKNKLKYSSFNLIVHESDLPKGKGFSPLAWQILNNKRKITFTLFEASKNLDSGKYYFKKKVYFGNNLLFDEIKEKQFVNASFLITKFLKKINKNIIPKSFLQKGKNTYFLRRYEDNSQLNIRKSLYSQFNLLRICDNKNYPAFFKIYNKKYIVKIFKS